MNLEQKTEIGAEIWKEIKTLDELAKSVSVNPDTSRKLALLVEYHTNHQGLKRYELSKRNRLLYKKILKEGLISCIPTHSERYKDPYGYYLIHYSGLTRGQLRSANQILYARMLKDRSIENIPLVRGVEYKENPLGYYDAKCKGMTQVELRQKRPRLHKALKEKGLLSGIPSGIKPPFYGEDPLGYYYKHHKGWARYKLFKKQPALYQAIRRAGKLHSVPTLIKAKK